MIQKLTNYFPGPETHEGLNLELRGAKGKSVDPALKGAQPMGQRARLMTPKGQDVDLSGPFSSYTPTHTPGLEC